MFTNYIKRSISLLLALVMVFSMIPMPTFATESADDHDHDHDHGSVSSTSTESATEPAPSETTQQVPVEEPVFSDAYLEAQAVIDDMLGWYLAGLELPTGELTDEEKSALKTQIEGIVANLDKDNRWMAQVEIEDLETLAVETLTEAECQTLLENNPALPIFAEAVGAEAAGPNLLADTNVADGKIRINNKNGKEISSSETSYSITANTGFLSGDTVTLKIYNASSSRALISFDYVATNASSFQIAGANAAANGSYSALVDPNGYIQVVISAGGFLSSNAKLSLTGITWLEVLAEAQITVECDNTKGSVTGAGT